MDLRGAAGPRGYFNESQRVPLKFQKVSREFQKRYKVMLRAFQGILGGSRRYHDVSGAFEGVPGSPHGILNVSMTPHGCCRGSQWA